MSTARSLLRSSVFALSALALATGCSTAPGTAPLPRAAGASLIGQVYGGQQPITAATIGLYAATVNGATDGMASTSILNQTVTTSDGTGVMNSNANAGNSNNQLHAGYFNITGDFTCPSGDPQVFLTAINGNPGLTAGTNNTTIQQMLPLGNCSTLAARPSIIINEATTVAMIAAVYPYMTAYNAVGSTAAHASALVAAFTTAAEYIDAATGKSPGPSLPAGFYADTAELYTLANSIAACVNTNGVYTNGDLSNCDELFTYATPPVGQPNAGVKPTNTATAILNIRNNPTTNVANIFNLSSTIVAFYPVVSAAPIDWSLPIVVQPGTPTFSPAGGSYAASQSVTINDSDATAVLYYTTDGSTPSTSSTVYTGPVTVSTAETLSALAVESGRAFSAVGSATYSGALTATAATPTFSPVAGTYTAAQTVLITSSTAGTSIYYTIDGSTPTTASALYTASGISVGFTQTVKAIAVAAGYSNSAVASAAYTINISSGTISTFAGDGSSGAYNASENGHLATSVDLAAPSNIAFDASGNMYIADYFNYVVRKVTPSGVITVVAGTGAQSFSGDGGPATSATLSYPYGVAVDASGNLYIADYGNNRIRKVDTSGTISTVAGTGGTGYNAANDGGPATSATLYTPFSVAFDTSGNMYIADTSNNRIRKVTAISGVITATNGALITTVAGSGTSGSFSGDAGQATSATLKSPFCVALDASNNIYIADAGNNRIRKVDTSGVINTIAGSGSGTGTFTGDTGAATSATLHSPTGVAIDASGNIYIADQSNNRIRKITSGVINTVAGNGGTAYVAAQDGGPATSATLNTPSGVALDASGNLYIADQNHNRVRKVAP